MKKFMADNEINDLLSKLLLQIQSILKSKFVGMYIGGSLANNSFNDETSDIDCYIITNSKLAKNEISKIAEMHNDFYKSKIAYANKIEASYLPQSDILNFDPKNTRPYFNEGKFYLAHYGSNFEIELSMLREKGITLSGPSIKNLIKEISAQDLKLAIHKNLAEYWHPTLNDLPRYERSDYQVFAILTMCRTLYSLETGNIASKMEAAQWAIDRLEPKWKELVVCAITCQPGQELNKGEEAKQFVKWIVDKVKASQ